jgi:hypothetical protein
MAFKAQKPVRKVAGADVDRWSLLADFYAEHKRCPRQGHPTEGRLAKFENKMVSQYRERVKQLRSMHGVLSAKDGKVEAKQADLSSFYKTNRRRPIRSNPDEALLAGFEQYMRAKNREWLLAQMHACGIVPRFAQPPRPARVRRPKGPEPEKVAAASKLYLDGASTHHLAATFGVAVRTVRSWLKSSGVQMRTLSQAQVLRFRRDDA